MNQKKKKVLHIFNSQLNDKLYQYFSFDKSNKENEKKASLVHDNFIFLLSAKAVILQVSAFQFS